MYDRISGLHCLYDEVLVPETEALKCGPRHLSIMMTSRCNSSCSYCYVEKNETEIDPTLLKDICDAASELGVLDLTMGGGEPTLHSRFATLISDIWDNYAFGLSVTTNGTNIRPLVDVEGKLTRVRVSIDHFERDLTTERMRQLAILKKYHPLGINVLFSPASDTWLSEVVDRLLDMGLSDILIIPEHRNGKFQLNETDWSVLENILSSPRNCEFKITDDALAFISCSTLDTAHEAEYLFAHIDDRGYIRDRSWGGRVSKVHSRTEIIDELRKQHPIRRRR